jgi:DHA2 family multidrug resistance protein
LFAVLLSPWVGRNVQRFDPRWLTTVAFVTFALVMFMRSRYTPQADFTTLMIPTFIQGIAMAFFFVPLVSISMSGLPPERIPAASGLNNFCRITAGAIGTSVVTTIWDNRAHMHHAQLVEQISQYNDNAQSTIAQLGLSGVPQPQALAMIDRIIDQQAYTLAVDEIFLWSSVSFLALTGVVWLARRNRPPAAGAPAGSAGAASSATAAGAH